MVEAIATWLSIAFPMVFLVGKMCENLKIAGVAAAFRRGEDGLRRGRQVGLNSIPQKTMQQLLDSIMEQQEEKELVRSTSGGFAEGRSRQTNKVALCVVGTVLVFLREGWRMSAREYGYCYK